MNEKEPELGGIAEFLFVCVVLKVREPKNRSGMVAILRRTSQLVRLEIVFVCEPNVGFCMRVMLMRGQPKNRLNMVFSSENG